MLSRSAQSFVGSHFYMIVRSLIFSMSICTYSFFFFFFLNDPPPPEFSPFPPHAPLPFSHYEEGFPASGLTTQPIDESASLTPDPEWHRVFRAAGRAPRLGEPLVQSDLARTLRDLGAEGPDLFYTGRVGRAIADRMAADGFLRPQDLPEHAGERGEPIATTHRGLPVYETPPP